MERVIQGIWLLYDNGILYGVAFVFGSIVGSFLNVVIHRWPSGESIVTPGSHCPQCRTPIPWYWNIPILSWILLRGRCRFCGSRISSRYFWVELVTGAWAVISLAKFGPGLSSLACFGFGAALICGSFIDIDTLLLPDVITLGMLPFGLAMAFLPESWVPGWPVRGWDSVLGAVLGAALFLLVLVIFKLATGRDGMGLGDVKLMGGVGAFLGYPALPAAILVAAPAGIITWVMLAALKKADRDHPLPFGPFLAVGAMVVVVTREWLEKNWVIIHWV